MATGSPLTDEHRSLGAVFTDFAGWQMPLRYGSETAEHRAVRTDAGLFDLSHMGEVHVHGSGAGAGLDYALVGQLSTLDVGRARYTLLCAESGGVLDDLIVYRLEPERFLVVANAANVAVVTAELTRRLMGRDAEVVDRSATTALVAVQGPKAAGLLADVTDADLPSLRYYACQPARVEGIPVLLARTGYTGEDGFELFCDPADAVALWRLLLRHGEGSGLAPAGLAARDTLRLEAGMPLYGNELSVDVTPFEAGLGRVVRLDKEGDFVGRAALQRRHDDGPREHLAGLVAKGRRVPRHGYPVLDAESGVVVGRVTSGAPSPTLGQPIALAYVDEAHRAPESPVAVDVRGVAEPATVVPLPFYRRPAS